jgi:hypothetical protein
MAVIPNPVADFWRTSVRDLLFLRSERWSEQERDGLGCVSQMKLITDQENGTRTL